MLHLLAVGPTFTRPACRAAAAAVDRYLLPAPALSSKPAGRRSMLSIDGTDRRTDTGPFAEAYRTLCGPHVTTRHRQSIDQSIDHEFLEWS